VYSDIKLFKVNGKFTIVGDKNFKIYKNGVYISLKVSESSKVKIHNLLLPYIPKRLLVKDLHVTLIQSKGGYLGDIKNMDYKIMANFKSWQKYGVTKDVLGIELKSKFLDVRYRELMDTFSFNSIWKFRPHISVMYKGGKNIDLNRLPKIDFPIYLEREHTEERKIFK
jgi:hypothetical protein